MKKWLLSWFVITLLCLKASAQIQLQNPSMEGTACLGYCYPNEWTFCETLCGVLDSSVTVLADKKPANPVDGIAYVFLENQPPLDVGSLAQYLQCPLKNGHTYLFQLHDATCWSDSANSEAFGYLQIYGGYDSCDRHQLLWQSELLDTVWKLETITFTPNANYDWFILWPQYDSIPFVDIAVDALSPIYLINANEVNVSGSTDTTIYPGNCVNLSATSTNTAYDSLYCKDMNTGSIISAGSWNTIVCPDSNATYLIAMRDSVPDCAGYKWSYDTVRVTVLDTATGLRDKQTLQNKLMVYPNPGSDLIHILFDSEAGNQPYDLTLKNMLGQTVYSKAIWPGISYQVDVTGFSAGAYQAAIMRKGIVVSLARFIKE